MAWLPSELHTLLLQHWQHDMRDEPLVLEREGEAGDYLSYLEPRMNTFFAVPLLGSREKKRARGDGGLLASNMARDGDEAGGRGRDVEGEGYYKPGEVRHEGLACLHD